MKWSMRAMYREQETKKKDKRNKKKTKETKKKTKETKKKTKETKEKDKKHFFYHRSYKIISSNFF
jgi:hypothetical protein